MKRARALLYVAALAIAACAPTLQGRLEPAPAGFVAPRFDVEHGAFYSFDGAELGLSVWMPPPREDGTPVAPWAVIVGLHGINDSALTFDQVARWFAARGVGFYGYDARGYGRSPQPGIWAQEAVLVSDAVTAITLARQAHPHARLIVLGGSMGAAETIVALSSETGRRLKIDRVVLLSPAVWGWSELPGMYRFALGAAAYLAPYWIVSPPADSEEGRYVSDNPVVIYNRDANPYRRTSSRVDQLYGFVGLMEAASQRTGGLRGNILFMYGAHDSLIPPGAAARAAARLPASARTAYYQNGYHTLLRDCQADVVYGDILAFIQDARAPLPSGAPPMPSAADAERMRLEMTRPRPPGPEDVCPSRAAPGE